ncbi:MAG: GNAT family N-acetyltransferase [Chloroflexota bacterium]
MGPSVTQLTTERLLLRHFRADDLAAYHTAIYDDPEVMRYLPGGAPRPIERAREVMDYLEASWQQFDFGGFALCLRDDDRLIGHIGLLKISRANPPTDEVELFYAIARPFWGRGYITEAARAVIDDGFGRRGLERIVAVAVPENTASRRVMEKLGMTFLGLTRRYYDTELAYYAIEKSQWQG